jgi:polyisoprenoid-binding protein YceI
LKYGFINPAAFYAGLIAAAAQAVANSAKTRKSSHFQKFSGVDVLVLCVIAMFLPIITRGQFMKKLALCIAACALSAASVYSQAADYVIDTKGAHAFVQFRVKHLGYSWLYGRFNEFSGEFSYDEAKPEASKIFVDINTTSLDSNHAERDKHLRSKDFLDTDKFPTAKFVSTAYKPTGAKTAQLTGDLTLHGVTKSITIDVEHIGGGSDPWGGYRNGFEGRTTIKGADFGIDMAKKLGPASGEIEMFLTVEGIRKDAPAKK